MLEYKNTSVSFSIRNWLINQRVNDFGSLAFATTPEQRCRDAVEMLQGQLRQK